MFFIARDINETLFFVLKTTHKLDIKNIHGKDIDDFFYKIENKK
mgnify:CR=1 FL=1